MSYSILSDLPIKWLLIFYISIIKIDILLTTYLFITMIKNSLALVDNFLFIILTNFRGKLIFVHYFIIKFVILVQG
jgi:hypothetical protein